MLECSPAVGKEDWIYMCPHGRAQKLFLREKQDAEC